MSQPSTMPPVPASPPPRKVWPWLLGAGCGVTLLLCCGVLGFSGYLATKFAKGISQDPTEVRAVAASIVEIALPPELAPLVSIKLPVPAMNMTFALFGNGDSMVMLGNMQGAAFANATPEALAQQMEEGMRAQSRGRETLEVENTEKREFTLRGQTVEFVISEGTGTKSSKKLIEALGAIPAGEGFIVILIHVEADKYSKERVVEIIESIR